MKAFNVFKEELAKELVAKTGKADEIKDYEEYIKAIKGFGKDYRFSLEDRLINGSSDYCDCKTADEVLKELKKFINNKNFNSNNYECLAILVYEAKSEWSEPNIDDEDNWGERVAEYYFV